MLNAGDPLDPEVLRVIDYANPVVATAMQNGEINTAEAQVLENIRSSIRRGYPQARKLGVQQDPQNPHGSRICLVGSGPSLADTEGELRDLYFKGCKVVTVNGAYRWCVERNIRPSAQVIVDARPGNARFVEPDVPQCQYLLASQCAPEVWDAVEGRPHVWIFHSSGGTLGPVRELLDNYYAGQWFGIVGGVTVVTRAIGLLRLLGYLRFDLFGVDSCWMGQKHHAFPQPENADDKWFLLDAGPVGGESRTFRVSPAHLKQLEDLLQMVKVHGEHFQLIVHGDGLIAYAMKSLAGEFQLSVNPESANVVA